MKFTVQFEDIQSGMFGEQLYQSSALSQLYTNHLTRTRVLRRQSIESSQRILMVQSIHMLLGMQSNIYQRTTAGFAATEQTVQLQHLAPWSVRECLRQLAECGSQLQYLRDESRRIYAFPNQLLRAFAQSALELVGDIEAHMTASLRVLQQERGNLERSEQEYQQSAQAPITILSLLQKIKSFAPSLTFAVSTLSRLALRDSPSQEDLQTAVLFLLNLYHMECSKQYCLNGETGVHKLLGGVLRGYLQVLKEWFQMQETTLAMKTQVGFFIELDKIIAMQQQHIFDVKRITRRQAIPNFFKSSYQRIVELGKTIQFIRQYFGPEQRNNYRQFMNIQAQFRPLFDFIHSLSPASKPFFQSKKSKFQTISSRLASMVRPGVISKKIQQDNPFKMYPDITGIINLRSDYRFPEKQSKTFPTIEAVAKNQKQAGLDMGLQMQAIMWGVLQNINDKCQIILQQDHIRSSIERTLKGIKKIMILEQGDFAQQLLQLARPLLEKPADKISINNMERLIEEAVRTSGANMLPQAIKQNISFSFLKSGQGFKAWRVFSLAYRPQKPTNCIFTQRVMTDYGYLSNILLMLRRCEQVLTEVWGGMGEGMGGVLKARNAVHHYLKALQSFLFSQLEAIWAEMLQAIRQTGNVLTILQINQKALNRIKAMTFQSQPLCNCLLALVKIVDRFENIQRNLQQGIQEGLRSDIDQIWSWFMGMLDQSRGIPNFSDTFDFRGEYSL